MLLLLLNQPLRFRKKTAVLSHTSPPFASMSGQRPVIQSSQATGVIPDPQHTHTPPEPSLH